MEEELVHEAYVVKPIFGGHNFFFRRRELLSSGQICVPWYNVVIAVQPRKKKAVFKEHPGMWDVQEKNYLHRFIGYKCSLDWFEVGKSNVRVMQWNCACFPTPGVKADNNLPHALSN